MLAPCRILIIGILLLMVWGCSTQGVRHVVLPGQTLYRISKTYGVSVDDVARYNHIRNTARIKAGDALWIPDAKQHKTVSIVPTTSSSPSPVRTTSIAKRSNPVRKPRVEVKPTRSYKSRTASRPRFAWPVQGKVVKGFKTGNKKGIEIAVATGTSVYSAAAGQVIYSSNDISGYGYLIIIRHSNDVYTVYGYNRKAIVKAGAFVGKKEKIAISGTPPGESRGGCILRYGKGRQM